MSYYPPNLTVSGNGTADVVSAYNSTESFWTIGTRHHPGLVEFGPFPNANNPYTATSSTVAQFFYYPFRGGRNYSNTTTMVQGVIGITSVGLQIYSPFRTTRTTRNGKAFTLNYAAVPFLGLDANGGYIEPDGKYRYLTPAFTNNYNSWIRTNLFGLGFRQRFSDPLRPFGHSLLIGWAADGYPIYGPFGYSNPLSSTSTVVRMQTGYRLQLDLANRPLNKTIFVNGNYTATQAITLFTGQDIGIGMIVTGSGVPANTYISNLTGLVMTLTNPVNLFSGQALAASYPAGCFVEDYVYSASTGTTLDIHNGRYCVTPEYPNGTYAYFASVDENNLAQYPYFIGPKFYGRLTADSTNVNLSALSISTGTLAPAFNSTITNYTITVPNNRTSTTFSPVLSDFRTKMFRRNFEPLNRISTGTSFTVTDLQVFNTLTEAILTVAEYEFVGSYTFSITRLPSTNNFLEKIELTTGSIIPVFSPGTVLYNATLTSDVKQIGLRVKTQDDTANMSVNGITFANNTFRFYPINAGLNAFDILVTAQSGATRLYELDINSLDINANLENIETSVGPISPQFSSSTFYYGLIVDNTVTNVSLRATVDDSQASLFLNDISTSSNVFSDPLNLDVGSNLFNFKVISADPIVTNRYRLIIVRKESDQSRLLSLTASTSTSFVPAFNSSTFVYVFTVTNDISSLTISPTAYDNRARILVGTQLVQSGSSSLPLPLNLGNNSILIRTLAADLITSSTYTINVVRNASDDSSLTDLRILGSSLVPSFSSDIFTYTAQVNHFNNPIYLIPTAAQPTSRILISGVNAISGQVSSAINTLVGTNTVAVNVVSPSSATVKTYVISVNREKNPRSELTSIVFDNDVSIDLTTTTQKTFSIPAAFDLENISFTLIRLEPSTSVVYTYKNIFSGTNLTRILAINQPSDAIYITTGTNVITINSTAENQINTTTYSFNITKAINPDSRLRNIQVNTGTLVPSFSPNELNYSLYLPSTVSSLTFTVTSITTQSTITVNAKDYISGSKTDTVPVYPGPNSIPIYSKSPTGTRLGYNIYAIKNTQPYSSDTDIAEIYTDYGLIQGLKQSVPNTIASTRFRVKTKSPNASVVMNYKRFGSTATTFVPLAYDIWSESFELQEATSRQFTFIVTSEDAVNNRSYVITIERLGSSDSNLKDIILSRGFLQPNFQTDIYDYTVVVPNSVDKISIRPIPRAASSSPSISSITSLKVNNLTVKYLEWSSQIPLIVGTTPIKIEVLAKDKKGLSFYYINAVRDSQAVIINTQTQASPILYPSWKTDTIVLSGVENTSVSFDLKPSVTNTGTATYIILGNDLPSTLSLNSSTGIISGTMPYTFDTKILDTIVRVKNPIGLSDTKLKLTIFDTQNLNFLTPGGALPIGPEGQKYIVNGQIVKFQFTATTDILPPGKTITYVIDDGDGELPKGLELTPYGELRGTITDSLRLPPQLDANDYGYDGYNYDILAYDFQGLYSSANRLSIINKLYSFYVTISNGRISTKRLFSIQVYDPGYFYELKTPNTFPVPPQWITDKNLGIIKANTFNNIKLEIHDCDPGQGYLGYISNLQSGEELPPGMSFDADSGILTGFVQYTPRFMTKFEFTIRAFKTNVLINQTSRTDRKFTLYVEGTSEGYFDLIQDTQLATMNQGQQSDLDIKISDESLRPGVRFSIVSGTLPPGLSLTTDGNIVGYIPYINSQVVNIDYTFRIRARNDNIGYETEKTFKITIRPYQNITYTNVVMKPLLSLEQESAYRAFIENESIFPYRYLYRPNDPAYGIQQELRMILEYAVEDIANTDPRYTAFVARFTKYFYRKKLYFGQLKVAKAKDTALNLVYEAVYAELIDFNEYNGFSIDSEITFNTSTIYPNSIEQMKETYESLFRVNGGFMPSFLKTVQDDTGRPLENKSILVICFAKPGKGQEIIKNIKNSGFDLKELNFDIDRLHYYESLGSLPNKYILFPTRTLLL